MADFRYYRSFPAAALAEKHNIAVSGDTLKAHLISAAPDPNDDVWADCSADELSTSGGYTSGGQTVTVTAVTETDGVTRYIVSAPEWTGSGGGFSFRALVIKNDTATSDELVGYIDFGQTITIAAGQSTKTLKYTDFDQTNGLFVFGGSIA